MSAAAIVAEAEDPVQAAIWVDALRAAGIKCTSYERGVGAALGGAVTPGLAVYPVLVAREFLGAARSVVAELGGAAALAPWPDSARERSRALRAVRTSVAVALAILLAGLAAKVLLG